MRKFSVIAFLLFLGTTGFSYAADLDNYYLEQFGEIAATSNLTALKSATAPQLRKCGLPLRRALRSDWKKLEDSTQKTLAKYLAKPVLANEATLTSSSGHFVIHYATTGSDIPTPLAPYTVASWIQKVADTFEEVYTKEVTAMGYASPAGPYPVYLQQLAGQSAFGFTNPDADSNNNVILTGQSATSYITIDNDFADALYHPYNGLSALQITAAHEFHHAIQFYYNYFFETWYAEATSTWMEDEAYDSVNQLYNYSRDYLLTPTESLNTPADGGYSRWLFNRSMAERHGQSSIRSVWEQLRNTTTQNGNDIPMLPVLDSAMGNQQSSIATEFAAFAKRLYLRDWTTHTSDLNLLYATSLTIESFANYPVNQTTAPAATTALPLLSMKYYKFIPSPSIPTLTITISKTSGTQTTLFRKTSGGATEIPANSSVSPTNYTYTVNGFSTLNPAIDEIVLMAANVTTTNNHVISVSTDGSTTPVIDPTTPPGIGGGVNFGSGGGCFIATAAYGSYLHPKVMILREFRDSHLLTNAPGRILVATYYRLSPPIAEFISRHELLRVIIRLLLAPVILTIEHFWLMLAAVSLLVGGSALRLKRKRKLKQCQAVS